MTNTLPVGTIITAKFTYGSEILHFKFYAIIGYTPKKVRIQEVESVSTYDNEGPHYYDSPMHIRPVVDEDNCAILKGTSKLVNYKFENGKMTFKPEEFYRFVGPWKGESLAIYNLH